MKILLTIIFDRPNQLHAFYDHYYKLLIQHLGDADVKVLMSKKYYNENKSTHLLDMLNPVLISESDMEYIWGVKSIDVFDDDIFIKIRNESLTEPAMEKFRMVIKDKLGDWAPDIVMVQGYETCYKFLKNIFPNSLCLNQENAIFSRPPFNRTLSYDPHTAVPDNFLVHFAEQIKSFEISDEQNQMVEKFKKSLVGIINKYSPLDDLMNFYYQQRFDKLVLLPLVGDKYLKLFDDCIYDDEFNLVETVMDKTPTNIGVFVTQADEYASLTPENIAYFQSKYPHFIYLQKTDVRGYANNSLNYFKYIDAVINITSKTAFMGMIYDVPVVSIAKQYNKWYADGHGIESLETVLNTPYKNKNNALYWYFTRYVLFSEDFERKNFMQNFLTGLLERYRNNGIDFNFYAQINDFDKIFDYIIHHLIQYYDARNTHITQEISTLRESHQQAQQINIDMADKLNILSADYVNLQAWVKYLQKHSLYYGFTRFMYHVSFGKTRRYFKDKKDYYIKWPNTVKK